mmetsp:Transcript_6790/g.7430  ORF Transcript_6790/g.7430 Transcript_6790/m.7430 type:complete len:208 (+) Transcript_6790:135-758(+)
MQYLVRSYTTMASNTTVAWYNKKENVEEYEKMCEGYDGGFLITALKKHLPEGSTLLELGMGLGKDLDLLKATYKVTGSDVSKEFMNRYKAKNPQADLIGVDAVLLDTPRAFDCIYSNKVLHHLSRSDLQISVENQKKRLSKSGVLFHTVWAVVDGKREESMHGMLFTYNTVDEIKALYEKVGLKVLESVVYNEMSDNDSFYIIAKKL